VILMNAAEVMTRNIVPIRGDMLVSEAIRLMLDNHIAGLPGRSRRSPRSDYGVIFDEKESMVLRVVAENPPRVRAVENYLVRVESVSGTITGARQRERTATKP
jgi:CBS domain-containing protein